MDRFEKIVFGIGLIAIVFCVGGGTGQHFERNRFQKEAIERNAGEYNPSTGNWQWNEGK